MTARPIEVDVLVVGARCAGASVAALLARAGRSVLLVDRAPAGSDALSTHALTRTAVLLLARWGVLDELRRRGTPRVSAVVHHYGDDEVRIPVPPDGDVDGLYAPRRAHLDGVLVAAARRAGAEVRHRTSLRQVLTDGSGRVHGAVLRDTSGTWSVRCRHLVGADGARSSVARLVGADIHHRVLASSATVYTFAPGLPDDAYHNHFRPGIAAGLIPTDDGLANVWVTAPPAVVDGARTDVGTFFGDCLRAAAPGLAVEVLDGRPLEPFRIFTGLPGTTRRAFGPGWSLVGDACDFKDPASAHGITDALVGAELLARRLVEVADGADERTALSGYATERMLLARPMMAAVADLASFRWAISDLPRLHRRINRAMRAEWDVVSALPPFAGWPPPVASGDLWRSHPPTRSGCSSTGWSGSAARPLPVT